MLTFFKDSWPEFFVVGQQQPPPERGRSWRRRAAARRMVTLGRVRHDKETRRERAASGVEHLERVVAGSVVRMVFEGPGVDADDPLLKPGVAWHGRVGVVTAVDASPHGEVVCTVAFADAPLNRSVHGGHHPAVVASDAVCKSNLQPDFNVRVFECFDTSTSCVLRELAESNRFVQKSAESTSM